MFHLRNREENITANILLPVCHCLQCFKWSLHVGVRQASKQSTVLHTNLVNGLTLAFLQPPFHLCHQVLKSSRRRLDQLQLLQTASRNPCTGYITKLRTFTSHDNTINSTLNQRFSNCGPQTPGGLQDDRRGSAVGVENCLKFQIRLSDQIINSPLTTFYRPNP